MSQAHTIIEYGRIYCAEDFKSEELELNPNRLFLPRNSFNNLKNYVAENTDDDIEVDRSFTIHRSKQRDFIRVKNYVGVVETRDGTTIEILPKIYKPGSQGDDLVEATRKTFLRMLKCLRNSPFINISQAHLRSCKFPILEVFITTYLEQLEHLIKQGIKHRYIQVEENQPFLKGKLLFTDQLRKNLVHPERFFVAYDRFDTNIPQNRLIKSTLIKLSQSSKTLRNQNRIRQYLFMFDEVPPSRNIRQDLAQASATQSRIFKSYEQLLKWARVFLLDESFTNFKGQHLNKAILFPMERIFEDYVSHQFRKHLRGFSISTQDSRYHLIRRHNGYPKFKLRPDIVLRKDDRVIVLDCKWKLLDESAPAKHYNIGQADMYQLHAYGKKYNLREKGRCSELVLIYPRQQRFNSELPSFRYDDDLHLKVVPFDLHDYSSQHVIGLIRNLISLPV